MTFRINESNLKDYLKVVKPIRCKKTTKDKYRIAVENLQRVYRSDPNKNYSERLMKATARVYKLEQQYRRENENS